MTTHSKVTTQDLVRDLAARLRVKPDQAERILGEMCATVREHLQTGGVVELADLFALRMSQQAEIREDESGGFSAYAAGPRQIRAQPIGALKTDLERAADSAIYYVAKRASEFHGLLADYFGRRGWDLVHVRNGLEVHGRLERKPAVALIFESSAEGWQDIVRELKCDPRTNWIPIVGLFPPSVLDQPVPHLLVQPDEIIREPFDFRTFVRTAAAELAGRVTGPPRDVFELEVHLPGGRKERRAARDMVEEILFRHHMPERFANEAGEALHEALDNAVRHGHRMVECCTIVMRVMIDPQRLVMVVRDTGPGFDHASAQMTARSRRRSRSDSGDASLARAARALGSRSKRKDAGSPDTGLTRLHDLVDQVDFNAKGNELYLSKRLPR